MNDSRPQATTSRRPQSQLVTAVKWTLLGTSLLAVIYLIANERETLRQALRIAPSQLVAVVALLVVYLVIYSYRFLILIEKHCDCRIGLVPWIRMLIVVRLMNNTVPQLGTIYRGVHLKRDFGVTYTDYISANVFFVISDTIFNFAIAGLLLLATGNTLSLLGVHASVWLFTGLLVLFSAPYVTTYLLSRFLSRAPRSKLLASLSDVANEMTRSFRDLRYMVHSNILALASFITMALVFHILLRTVEVDLPFATLAVFYALYRLTFHITITPGNIGIRELAYGLLCAQADVAVSKGVLISAEVRILAMLVLLLMGFILAWRDLREAWIFLRSGTTPRNDS